MMTISITKLYDLISTKMGRETAENLTTFIEEKIKSEVDSKASNLATKEDLAREIGNCRADVIKWMFVFWVGQLTAFVLLFLKK